MMEPYSVLHSGQNACSSVSELDASADSQCGLALLDMSRVTDRLRFIEPQLLTLVDQPPQGPEWIHEVKHEDGQKFGLIHK